MSCRPSFDIAVASTRAVMLLPAYTRRFLPETITTRPVQGEAPTHFLTSALGGQGSVMRSGSTDCPETFLWPSAFEDMRANVTARWTVH